MFRPVCLWFLRCSCDLCLLYQLRICRLTLPHVAWRLSFDAAPPHLSPIPASPSFLVVGIDLSIGNDPRWAAFSAAASDADWTSREPPWLPPRPDPSVQSDGEAVERWLKTWKDPSPDDGHGCLLLDFPTSRRGLDAPLLPGLPPSGLRLL